VTKLQKHDDESNSSTYSNEYLLSSTFSALRRLDNLCTTRGLEVFVEPTWLYKRTSATRLNTRPTIPTYSSVSGSLTVIPPIVNRCIASTTMAKHSASRNTELTNAPRTSALTQPYVFFGDRVFDICGKSHKISFCKNQARSHEKGLGKLSPKFSFAPSKNRTNAFLTANNTVLRFA